MEREIFASDRIPVRMARVVSEVGNPLFVALPLFLIVAIVTAPDVVYALLWWVITVGGMTAAPYLFILRGVRSGKYSDHMVSNRKQRLVPLSFGLGCMVVAFILLLVLGASHAMLATAVAVILVLACCILVTQKWKISLHLAGFAGAVTALVFVLGPLCFLLSPLALVLGWARWQVRAHTPWQSVGGAGLAVCITVVTFLAFGVHLP
jgi:hypothetical protein